MDELGRWVLLLAAFAFSCGLFMLLHAADWRRLFGKRPEAPWTYVAGILGLAVPFTLVMALWGDWWGWLAAVAVVAGAGCSVTFGYKVRGQGPILKEQSAGQEDIIKALRNEIMKLEGKLMALEGGTRWAEGRTRRPGA